MMTSGSSLLNHTDSAGAPFQQEADHPSADPPGFLILAIGCGLLAGLLEVATVVVRKRFFDSNHLYGMSRHFVWTVPVIDACLFFVMGVVLGAWAWWSGSRRFAVRVIVALTVLPVLLAAFPQIYGVAWLVVAWGIAIRVAPALEQHSRLVQRGFPVLAACVMMLAVYPFARDRYRGWRESSRALPASGAPNVILLVLDTVAADHLGLFGYNRPTSPTLDELARRGVCHSAIRATSSWTLPSHAGMFTGRWPHELSAGWLNPLDAARPTLAAYLSSHGYATAGFVANTLYCASDSGLDRGFTTYLDFPLTPLGAIKTAVLVSRSIEGVQTTARWLDDQLGVMWLTPKARMLGWLLDSDRKDAATVNRQFLEWLAREQESKRPFFAFLNYYDAHFPYQLPPTGVHRFGVAPRTAREADFIANWWLYDKTTLSPSEIAFARDLYDDCVAHLDEQVGRLIDVLEQNHALENTWLIVVADHGESFGEHEGVYCHGMSLYQTELHVPMVIVPPGPPRAGRVVSETASLRDLPATIVDILGLKEGARFPGTSLVGSYVTAGAKDHLPNSPWALSEVVPNNPLDADRSRLMVKRPPLVSLAEPDWSYIRREDSRREELFHLKNDAGEAHDLSNDPQAASVLARLRDATNRLMNEPAAPAPAGLGH